MENDQKTSVKDEKVDNSADIVTSSVVISMKDDSARSEDTKSEMNEVETIETQQQQKLDSSKQDATSEQTLNEINSELEENENIDEIDQFVKDDNKDFESNAIQKSNDISDSSCGAEKTSSVLLVDSSPKCLTLESSDVSEFDVGSSKTFFEGKTPSEDLNELEAITTVGDMQMECEFGHSPEKNVPLASSELSEIEPITFNLNSSPLQDIQSLRERSVSMSSTYRDVGSDKPNEIFELTDDDEDEENGGDSDRRHQRNKFDQSNELEDDIGSDTFEDSSEDDGQSVEPMDDDYDSEEHIHSIDDSDEDDVSVPKDVR